MHQNQKFSKIPSILLIFSKPATDIGFYLKTLRKNKVTEWEREMNNEINYLDKLFVSKKATLSLTKWVGNHNWIRFLNGKLFFLG